MTKERLPQGVQTAAVDVGFAWFAIAVRPQCEKSTASALRAKELEEFLPLYRETRRWSDRMKTVELPLFAGYVFCRFGYADRLAVLNTPGVVAIIGARNVFSPIPDEEIAAIQKVVQSGVPAAPYPYFEPGQPVVVESGPLAGVRGTVVRNKGVTSIAISVELLRRSIIAEVDVSSVRPIRAESPRNLRSDAQLIL